MLCFTCGGLGPCTSAPIKRHRVDDVSGDPVRVRCGARDAAFPTGTTQWPWSLLLSSSHMCEPLGLSKSQHPSPKTEQLSQKCLGGTRGASGKPGLRTCLEHLEDLPSISECPPGHWEPSAGSAPVLQGTCSSFCQLLITSFPLWPGQAHAG